MLLTVVEAPEAYALDWDAQVRGHLRLDSNDEQARVMSEIVPAADQKARSETNLSLITRTLKFTLDEWPCAGIELPRGPVQSVTHVKYIDGNGTQQTWSATTGYEVFGLIDEDNLPPDDGPPPIAVVRPRYGQSFPTFRRQYGAIEIVYVVGYGDTWDAIPAGIRSGMLLIVGELFERREEAIAGTIIADVPLASANLFRQYRIPKFREGWAA